MLSMFLFIQFITLDLIRVWKELDYKIVIIIQLSYIHQKFVIN